MLIPECCGRPEKTAKNEIIREGHGKPIQASAKLGVCVLRPGSGLGLTIVARIAELHGTSPPLDTSNTPKGLLVTVQFAVR